MKRYNSLFEMSSDSDKSLVVKKKHKMVFLNWFNKIWGGEFSHITDMKEKGGKLYFSIDLNLHNMELIRDSFKDDTGIKIEIK